MEFSPEELDVSPPCFLVDNSQAEESQQVCRSDSDQHVSILKRLPVFAMSASICSTNESLRRHPVVRSRPTGSTFLSTYLKQVWIILKCYLSDYYSGMSNRMS